MNNYSKQPLTGEHRLPSRDTPTLALMCPVVLRGTLLDAKEMINDKTKSGKQKGAMLIHTEVNGDNPNEDLPVYLIVAKGSDPKDDWLSFKTTVILPPA